MQSHRNRAGIALLTMLAVTAAATAFAQYTGPGARQAVAHTVAEVLEDPRDDRPVDLTGNLVRQTGRKIYLFRDATGEIEAEIDAEDFPANQPVGPETRVRLSGEVEARLLRAPRLDVERLHLVAETPAS